MVKIRELTDGERRQIVILREEGISVGRIARRFRCCRQTVYRVCKRHEETGNERKLPRGGRPRVTTNREDRRLLTIARLMRFNPVKILAGHWCQRIGRNVSTRTARRRLRSARVFSRVARRKPFISLVNRQRRVQWAARVRHWTVQDNWRHIVFSDESRFNLSFDDGSVRVWRESNAAYDPTNLLLTTRNATSVMVWGCIGQYGVGDLVVVDGNLNNVQYRDILNEHLISSVENIFGDREYPFVFQDDNATPHRARAVQDWMFQQGINRMDWPAQSPDANPIENIWNDIGKAITKERPFTRQALIGCIFRAWGDVTQQRLDKLYDTLPRRMAAIIRSRGYPTKY